MRGTREQTMYDDLVRRLRKCATEAGACKTCELDSNPSCTDVLMEQAADAIEELQKALLLMVLQYCTTDDGLLYNSFMSAGENAFAVLGLENGQQAEPLWDRVLQNPQNEE